LRATPFAYVRAHHDEGEAHPLPALVLKAPWPGFLILRGLLNMTAGLVVR
jgi:hypothetical protein